MMLRRAFIQLMCVSPAVPATSGKVELQAIAAEMLPRRAPLPQGLPASGIYEFRAYEGGLRETYWFPDLAERAKAWNGVARTPSRPLEISIYRVVLAR
jgi:hypothetical protein